MRGGVEDPFEFPGVRPRLFDGSQAISVGALGRVYVAGWANLEPAMSDDQRVRRVLVVQKLGPHGGRVWTWTERIRSRHGHDRVTGVSVRGDLLMVVARLGEAVVPAYRSNGAAWIGRLSFDGTLRWSRTWGDEAAAGAEPSEVAIGPNGLTHVNGRVRDPATDRVVAFLRAFGAGGRLIRGTNIAIRTGSGRSPERPPGDRRSPARTGMVHRFSGGVAPSWTWPSRRSRSGPASAPGRAPGTGRGGRGPPRGSGPRHRS